MLNVWCFQTPNNAFEYLQAFCDVRNRFFRLIPLLLHLGPEGKNEENEIINVWWYAQREYEKKRWIHQKKKMKLPD